LSTLRIDNFGPSAGGTTYSARGIAKAWVNFNGTGTIAARDSENVSSLTDNGTGEYTITISNDFSNTNYLLLGTCLLDNNTDGRGFVSSAPDSGGFAPAVGSAKIGTVQAGIGSLDFAFVNVAFSGDLA
jgi:hypothetical protein